MATGEQGVTVTTSSALDLLGGPGAARTPVVLPFAPRAGWARATTPHRVLAVLCPVLLVVWVVLAALPSSTIRSAQGGVTAWNSLYLPVGPVAFFAAARVLRPYSTGVQVERVLRHGCAAVATAYGSILVVVLAVRSGNDVAFSISWLMVVVCLVLGAATMVWGCVAAMVRVVAGDRPLG